MQTTDSALIDQPRSSNGRYSSAPCHEAELPDFQWEADEFTADWEAGFRRYDDARAQEAAWADRRAALSMAADENLLIAEAAQSNRSLNAGDLLHLHESRLLVPAGAFANPSFGKLPFTVQLDLVDEAFPEEQLVAARNRCLHPEILDFLSDADDAVVAAAAKRTLEVAGIGAAPIQLSPVSRIAA
ncbi:hypothetical protein [Leifsonia sp. Leaf264]|uniref:hypothetical protein n=1 Tax=Leifsonia sp. Leaf264 TaxID=1736314 RepID=UPI0006F86B0A|nr:hypothetical protein [Leifsonia sp. Leaf264]KQO98845.1 hypothetical protein ASF30_12345 [Leifsonia sp. Leaf264]